MEVNGLLIPLQALQLSGVGTGFARPGRVQAVQEPSRVPAPCFGAGGGGGSGVRGHRLGVGSPPLWRHMEAFIAACLNTG